jgi:hypothetical protein
MALPLLFTFDAILPPPSFRNPWLWILIWLPAIALSGWGIKELFHRVYQTANPHDLPRWYLFVVGICVLLYGFGGLIAWRTIFEDYRSKNASACATSPS